MIDSINVYFIFKKRGEKYKRDIQTHILKNKPTMTWIKKDKQTNINAENKRLSNTKPTKTGYLFNLQTDQNLFLKICVR